MGEVQGKKELDLKNDEREITQKMMKAAKDIADLQADDTAENKEETLRELNQTMATLATQLLETKAELAKIPGPAVKEDRQHEVDQAPPGTTASSDIISNDNPAGETGHSIRMSGFGKASGSVTVKPPRLKKDGEVWIFLDRFEQYLKLCGNHNAEGVELLMLSLVQDDKMYRKLKSTFVNLPNVHKMSISELMTAIRSGLYPGAKSRTLRDAMSQMKQSSEESAEDYGLRIEVEAAKAFSPQEEAVKNEACLAALSNGLRSLDIRRRIKESEVKDFDKATRLAIKLEHIYDSTPDENEQNDVTSFGVLAVNNPEDESYTETGRDHQPQNRPPPGVSPSQNGNYNPRSTVTCYNCNRQGHVRRNCSAPPTGRSPSNNNYRPFALAATSNIRRNGGEIRCHECGGRGHYANQCATRENRRRQSQRRGPYTETDPAVGDSLNGNTAGSNPVSASRQSQH